MPTHRFLSRRDFRPRVRQLCRKSASVSVLVMTTTKRCCFVLLVLLAFVVARFFAQGRSEAQRLPRRGDDASLCAHIYRHTF